MCEELVNASQFFYASFRVSLVDNASGLRTTLMNVEKSCPPGSLPPACHERARANVALAYEKIKENNGDPESQCWVVDCGASIKFLSYRQDETPCLLRSRCGATSYWCSSLGRYLTTEDRMELQGFVCSRRAPDTAMNRMLGNSMSVNVVQSLLLQACWAMGFGQAST